MKNRNRIKKKDNVTDKILLIIILLVVIFASAFGGYIISANFFVKVLDEEQIQLCEETARDVYEQKEGGNKAIKIPDKMYIDENENTITVGMKGHLGKIEAQLQNGELVYTYISLQYIADTINFMVALMCLVVSALIFTSEL